MLFQQSALYKNLADQADAAQTPKPQLRRLLATRFDLSDFDNANLERLALAYHGEIEPVHQQVLTVIRQFHAKFPSGVVGKGIDASPPPELAGLQQQGDAVTLRYRDLLRSSMREEDFQKLHAKVRATFGSPLSGN